MTPNASGADRQGFQHSLVVGGTGMLADATRFIRARSQRMTIVARRPKVTGVMLSSDEACAVDWRDVTAFSAALSPRLSARPPDLALLWMHSSGDPSLLWLLGRLVTRPALIVHVLGSSSGDPRGGTEEIGAIVTKARSAQYVTVVLGSKALAAGGRRWLTNFEISTAAIEAIQNRWNVVAGEIVPVS
jgi:hypothetical protein